MFLKIIVLKKLFHRKARVSESFLKKPTMQAFSCQICEIFKNTLFYRTPLVAATDSFRFLACNFIKKETPIKMFFENFVIF